jgi:hypothetical protein
MAFEQKVAVVFNMEEWAISARHEDGIFPRAPFQKSLNSFFRMPFLLSQNLHFEVVDLMGPQVQPSLEFCCNSYVLALILILFSLPTAEGEHLLICCQGNLLVFTGNI